MDNVCPECGRKKAHSVGDVLKGLCPKWWAIRDAEAEEDCKRFASHQADPADAKYCPRCGAEQTWAPYPKCCGGL